MGSNESGVVLPAVQFHMEFIPEGAAAVKWKLCTNYGDGEMLAQRFQVWPDVAVPPLVLDALYQRTHTTGISGYTLDGEGGPRPLFPYLDEEEGTRLSQVFARAKDLAYPPLGGYLQKASPAHNRAESLPLIFQTLLTYALRKTEKEIGLWDRRTPEQRTGSIFALGSHMPVTFTRVWAFVVGQNMRLQFPWGGPYGEYSKILYMMEDIHTAWMLSTADEHLRLLLGGLVSRPLTILELVDTWKASQADPLARLNVSSTPVGDAVRAVEELKVVATETARGFAQALRDTLQVWKAGRFAYLEGPGDYLEMSYSVALGHLFQWAMEDGLLLPPPQIEPWGDNWRVKKSRLERVALRRPAFHGLHVLHGADSVWEALRSAEKDMS